MEGVALDWPLPERLRFKGRAVELEPMSEGHVSELWPPHKTQPTPGNIYAMAPFLPRVNSGAASWSYQPVPISHSGLLALSQRIERRDGFLYATYTRPMAP